MQLLYDHICSITSISEGEFEKAYAYFSRLEMKKGKKLIRPEQYVLEQYFVSKGCLHTFLKDEKEHEHTIQFAIENWWASDYFAYFTGEKSKLYVECLEDSILLKISKNDLKKVYKLVPSFERFFRIQLEKAFVSFQRRILSNLSEPAESRYLNFIETYPSVEQRVKNYQIASFLGIAPESLSRVRKNIQKKGI